MVDAAQADEIRRLLVVIPNWVGDVVLATPTFAALRARHPAARITFLMRRYLAEVTAGGNWHDAEAYWPNETGLRRLPALLTLAQSLRAARHDAALLLTNSFQSALLAWLARIPRRVGYARDGRSALLTERLAPPRANGALRPTPAPAYYATLAARLGSSAADLRLRLGTTPRQEQDGRELLERLGLLDTSYAVINPGAAYGAAKCWLPERFAELCDRLAHERGWRCVVVGAAHEAPLMRAIATQARSSVVCCDNPGTTLGSLKVVIREARLLVCNDTGPRHYGVALGTPTVTVFGPTDPAWTETGAACERKVRVPVPCGPCQLKRCPLDHRCMTEVSVDMVMAGVRAVLERGPAPAADGAGPAPPESRPAC